MNREKKQLFALLIGINNYKVQFGDLRPLRGAVPDAMRFNSYFTDFLGVPSSQITILTNEHATRSKIIAALKNFREDKRINKDDAIFLFYAGHGIRIDPPQRHGEWSGAMQQKIECIVPYDCDFIDNGALVPPIPDYMFEILLSKIAKKKGNNITVVFDCCHSASGTRGVSSNTDNNIVSRSVHIEDSTVYFKQLSQELLEVDTATRGASIFSKFVHRGLGSHILLSACGRQEEAKEDAGHGRFSTALLNLLFQVSPEDLRYFDILNHPKIGKIKGQTPQCEGLNLHRKLFNAKVLPSQRKLFDISFIHDPKSGCSQHTVHGGAFHNINTESEFAVYRKNDLRFSTQIAVIQVDKLHPFSFTAKFSSGASSKLDLTQPLVAVQTNYGKPEQLGVYIDPKSRFRQTYRTIASNSGLKQYFDNIVLLDTSQNAAVTVEMTNKDALKFTVRVPILVPKQMTMEQIIDDVKIDANNLALIFSKIAHFYRELKYVCNEPRISQFVDVNFYQLKECSKPDDTGLEEESLTPIGQNLCVGGVVELVIPDEEIPYGIRIINRSTLNLYANLFYFDCHDLSIFPIATAHTSHTDHTPDVPLEPNGGILDIGFGTAGYHPFCFQIAKGSDVAIGFLKIYLSIQSVSLAYLPQPSPFASETTRAGKGHEPKPRVTWTNIDVPVVLRRRPVSRVNPLVRARIN